MTQDKFRKLNFGSERTAEKKPYKTCTKTTTCAENTENLSVNELVGPGPGEKPYKTCIKTSTCAENTENISAFECGAPRPGGWPRLAGCPGGLGGDPSFDLH